LTNRSIEREHSPASEQFCGLPDAEAVFAGVVLGAQIAVRARRPFHFSAELEHE
jgi:hypothetical protein